MLDRRTRQVAILIIAFVVLYEYYILSGFYGWFLDVEYRKCYIYALTMIYCGALIYGGNYNHKSLGEIRFRNIATIVFCFFCTGVILTNLSILVYPIRQISVINFLSILLVVLATFKADKNGNI